MARLHEKFREEVFPQLQKEFGLTNPMQVPKITKITCNIGVGEASRNAKLLDVAMEQLANITGQLPDYLIEGVLLIVDQHHTLEARRLAQQHGGS